MGMWYIGEGHERVPRAPVGAVVLIAAALLSAPFALAAAETAPETAPTFDVLEYRVLGNSSLPTIEIERAVYPFLGPGKSLKDVEAARVALEHVYHDRGFGTVFVDIPEQNVTEGIVRLHVAEGRLSKVTVTGARYFAQRDIKAQVPSAHRDAVPNLPQLQSELSSLNTETPDRVVVPVLRAGTDPGTVDLALKVDDHLPFHGSLEVNNQQTPDTKPLRTQGAVSYDNLFGELDHLGAQYQTAPQEHSQVEVIALNFSTPIDPGRSNVSATYIKSNTDVATLGTLGVLGRGSIYGLRYSRSLESETARSQGLSIGVDFKDFQQSIFTGPAASLNTPISYLNWSAAYNGSWRTARQQWNLDVTGNLGIRGVGNYSSEFANKRFEAQPNYFYVRSDASWRFTLPARFGLLLRAGGQYAVDPVISNEQFVIGGINTARGYLEAEELGDRGFNSTAQVETPALRLFAGRVLASSYVFFDLARVTTIDPLPGESANAVLRSAGVGLSLQAFEHFAGNLAWADPLVSGSRTARSASRLLFSVNGSW